MNDREDQEKQETEETVKDETEKHPQISLTDALAACREQKRTKPHYIVIPLDPEARAFAGSGERREKIFAAMRAMLEELSKQERKKPEKREEKEKQKDLLPVRRTDSVRMNGKNPPHHNFRVHPPRRRRSRR